MASIRETNEQFQRNVHQLMRTVRTLSDEQFTEPMDGCGARRSRRTSSAGIGPTIESAKRISAGEVPPDVC